MDITRFPAPFAQFGFGVKNGWPIFYNGIEPHKNEYGNVKLKYDASVAYACAESEHVEEEKIQTIETKKKSNPYVTRVNKLLLIAAMQPGSMTFEQIFDMRTGKKLLFGKGLDPTVDHINGDAFDNSVINLRVITRSENSKKNGHRQPKSNNSFHYCIGPARLNPDNISEWYCAEYAKELHASHPLKKYTQVFGDNLHLTGQVIQALLGSIEYMRLDDDPNTRCWIHPKDIAQRLNAIEQFKLEGAVQMTYEENEKQLTFWVDKLGFILRPGEPYPRKGLPVSRKHGLERMFCQQKIGTWVYSGFYPGYDGKVKTNSCQYDHVEGVKLYPCYETYEVEESREAVEITFLEYLEAWEASIDENDPSLKIYVRPLYSSAFATLHPKSEKKVVSKNDTKKEYYKLKLRGLYTYVPGETKLTDAMAIYWHQEDNNIMATRVNPNRLDENIPAEHKGLKRHGEELEEENQDAESAAKRQNRSDPVDVSISTDLSVSTPAFVMPTFDFLGSSGLFDLTTLRK
jgi:hypothetical protein